jgi:hypothetical protein
VTALSERSASLASGKTCSIFISGIQLLSSSINFHRNYTGIKSCMLLLPLCFDDYPDYSARHGMQRKHTQPYNSESTKHSWNTAVGVPGIRVRARSGHKAQPQRRHRRMPVLAFNEAVQYGDCSRHERKHNSHSENGLCYKKFYLKWSSCLAQCWEAERGKPTAQIRGRIIRTLVQ